MADDQTMTPNDGTAGAADTPAPRPRRVRTGISEAEHAVELAQARALAQVSQAEVARRQRADQKAASDLISGEAPKPARRRRAAAHADGPEAVRPARESVDVSTDRLQAAATKESKTASVAAEAPVRAAASEAPAAEVSQSVAPSVPSDAADAPKPEKKSRRRTRKTADDGQSPDAPAPAEAAPAAPGVALGPDGVPVIDPALRPHRRGRKPKAYVEAERAAAALAARADAAQDSAQAEGGPAGDADKKDTRPGRARRSKDVAEASADAAPAPEEAPRPRKKSGRKAKGDETPAGDGASSDSPSPSSDVAETAPAPRERRQHQRREDRHAAREQRADRRERNGRNGKRGNRFNAGPVEPSVSREELAALKVAELRERARELDIDVAGKKKAELVEEIYLTAARAEGFRDIEGILDITNEGFGYIRAHGYMPSRDDAFVPAQMIRGARLRAGDIIAGTLRPSRTNDKFPGLAKIRSVNGLDPEEIRNRPKFSDLTPIYPNEPLKMEHGRESITGRAIDIVSPIGKGQRGLIVSPPKAGKTTILKKICQSIAANNPEVHLICLLVDERPEEVTDMERSIKGDVVASTFDMPADNHTRVSELVIERAKRIVELGGDVVVVLDSITRLARAYNLAAPASGRILSGGVDSAALYPPKRFLGAARNIENGGSLTILASALVDTGSKMDEVIFEEFKGTGNMELKLDRDLADRRIFPAIDPIQSGTRNEDLLLDKNMQPFVWGIRRILSGMNNTERAAASFIKGLKGTDTNEEFLIRTARKAADHPEAL
ncbi:MAG: transcription termination factor Rho [Collinsella phocaeensis]